MENKGVNKMETPKYKMTVQGLQNDFDMDEIGLCRFCDIKHVNNEELERAHFGRPCENCGASRQEKIKVSDGNVMHDYFKCGNCGEFLPCRYCGTNGGHYCPNDVARG